MNAPGGDRGGGEGLVTCRVSRDGRRCLITAAAVARARDAARTRIGPDTSMKAATHVQLACWRRQGEHAPVETPDTRYAKTEDGTYIAYQVVGEGPDLAGQLDFQNNVEDVWEDPLGAAWWPALARFSRLILHDRRGVGLSSRNVAPPDLETRVADFEVVLDAAGADHVALAGFSEFGAPNVLFAASHPERVRSIVWMQPMARSVWIPDYPWGYRSEEIEAEQQFLELWAHADSAARSRRSRPRAATRTPIPRWTSS